MEYVLETNNIEKRYGHFKALTNLNMHIPKGAIYGLIGKNGAGKTTLIRLVCGLQKATSGEYIIFGISNKSKKIIIFKSILTLIFPFSFFFVTGTVLYDKF